MKLKHLQSHLHQYLPPSTLTFPSPNVSLEQYPTSIDIASHLGVYALSCGDIIEVVGRGMEGDGDDFSDGSDEDEEDSEEEENAPAPQLVSIDEPVDKPQKDEGEVDYAAQMMSQINLLKTNKPQEQEQAQAEEVEVDYAAQIMSQINLLKSSSLPAPLSTSTTSTTSTTPIPTPTPTLKINKKTLLPPKSKPPGTSILDLGSGPSLLGLTFLTCGCSHLTLLDCDLIALIKGGNNGRRMKWNVNDVVYGRDFYAGEDGEDEHLTSEYQVDYNYDINLINTTLKFTPKVDHKGQQPTASTAIQQNTTVKLLPGGVSESDGLNFLKSNSFDIVITNPPFGTKSNAGIDLQFLYTALRLSINAVYSFHKTSTRPYIVRCLKAWGYKLEGGVCDYYDAEGKVCKRRYEPEVTVVCEVGFEVRKTEGYGGHKLSSKDVEVDVFRVDKGRRRERVENEKKERVWKEEKRGRLAKKMKEKVEGVAE